MEYPTANNWRKFLAWCVHGFTASGLIVGFICLLAISEKDFRVALLCLLAAFIIDSVDGFLARCLKVQEVLPHYDGRMLDWVSDFVNFSFLPVYLFYEADLVTVPINWVCVIAMLLSSAYHFGNKQALTATGHFRGFPALWNIVVFYMVVIPLPGNICIIIVAIFFALHFLPIHFVYPTRMKSGANLLIWMVCLGAVISGIYSAQYYGSANPEPLFWQISIGCVLMLLLIGVGLMLNSNVNKTKLK